MIMKTFTLEQKIVSWNRTPVEILAEISQKYQQDPGILGLLQFGSTVDADPGKSVGDIDLGVVYDDGFFPREEAPSILDIFYWERRRWEKGFCLQLELARNSKILYDPYGVIRGKLEYLRRMLLPDWQQYLIGRPLELASRQTVKY